MVLRMSCKIPADSGLNLALDTGIVVWRHWKEKAGGFRETSITNET